MPLDGLGMSFFCVDILDLETQLGKGGEGNLIVSHLLSIRGTLRFRRTGGGNGGSRGTFAVWAIQRPHMQRWNLYCS